MPMLRIAVLFDAENTVAGCVSVVLERLRDRGRVVHGLAVGDFANVALARWVEVSRRHGIELLLQPCLGKGKNSADIALTIAALDLARNAGVEAIALVSSDRDFTPLALRLRRGGLEVFGFGRGNTSEAFRSACSQFNVIEPPLVQPVATPLLVAKPPVAKTVPVLVAPTLKSPPPLSARERATLLKVLHALPAGSGGLIIPGNIGLALRSADPALAARIGGPRKLLNNLVAYGVVERVGAGAALKVKILGLRAAS
ncbi:MAG: hypothetical protein JWR75_857 [Devosia sp.]|nr:hypothetical protein [Devosia sp.]